MTGLKCETGKTLRSGISGFRFFILLRPFKKQVMPCKQHRTNHSELGLCRSQRHPSHISNDKNNWPHAECVVAKMRFVFGHGWGAHGTNTPEELYNFHPPGQTLLLGCF